MAYLVLGEEFHKHNKQLFYDILESLDNYEMEPATNRVVKITFDSDDFTKDEFCIAMIKNDKTKKRGLYFWGIIQGDKMDEHLPKK